MTLPEEHTVITADHVIYHFHPDLEAKWHVAPHEQVEIRCPDGVHGQIRTEQDRYVAVDYDHINDAVGPIHVAGAEPGDRLIFDIHDIQIPQDWGYVLVIPNFGLLQAKVQEARTKIVPIKDGCVHFDGMRIPLDPCIGTIGVATHEGRYNTVIPFDHGGNMDTTAIRAGARVHFPVNQPGGLIAMGDAKAVMGDGEVCGTGVGVPINIFAHFEVVKGGRLSRPVIETAGEWQFIASAETLEQACILANEDLIGALMRSKGLPWADAYMLTSLVGQLRISQVVDPLMTVRMAISKDYLPTLDKMA
ncbi:amidase [Rhodoligotrophos appendicifer]|uniref:acetamidase/formamidase family protein n=1 Tax=Rhodoligotrophos appendicifer TaxID=987056 RepID=UPI001186C3CF|nr:acetamidase/formamidase family protein [Rhodoligotrophos appendicifer]